MPIDITPDDIEILVVQVPPLPEVTTVEVPGLQGPPGASNVLSIGTVSTLTPGSSATASITGTSPSQTFNLGIPRGDVGATGPANSLAIGTVTTGTPGSSASATITGSAPSQTLNLTIPRGDVGATGSTGPTGAGVPVGGTTGQLLKKNTGTNYDTVWADPSVTAAQISDSTATGRSVVTAANAGAARTAIGAGTSSLVIGTASTDAKAGDYTPPDASAGTKGLIQLAGHLTGTAAVPNVRTTSSAQTGVVQLATNTEATTGTDTAKAVTAAGVKAVADTKAALSHTHVATTDLTATGTKNSTTFLRGDDTWAVPPSAADATTGAKGIIQLAGDLAGTAASPTVPNKANNSITISAGTGLTGGGDLTANRTLTVSYGSASGTAVQGNDARVTADQAAGTASIRTIGTGALQAAAGNHTHTATGISDSTSTGRSLMTAADAAAARSTLGVDASMTFTATKTTSYTVAANEIAVMNVAGGGSALTLPTAPTAGMRVGFQAIGATTGTPLTITRGGTATIGDAGATTDTTPLAGVVRVYEYDNANTRWITVQDFKPLPALDSRFAAASHTHTASQISDSTSIGRSVLTSADAAAVRTAISAPFGNGITEVRLLTQATYDGLGSWSSSTLYVIVG